MMLGQLVDHGIAYTPAVYENGVPTAANDGIERKNEAFDLSPEGIWPLHERFAEWLGKDRQVNTVDVNLTLPEIANFRHVRLFFGLREVASRPLGAVRVLKLLLWNLMP